MPSTLIVNARLVNEDREFDSDLRIEKGRIAQIGKGLAVRPGDAVVDAAGRRLLPGMIDDQVHFREPGLEYKADMATESAAAVAGGLTSFMDMPNTNPPTLDAAALEDKYRRAAGRAWANHGFYMGASNDNLEAIRALDPLTAPGVNSASSSAVEMCSTCRRVPCFLASEIASSVDFMHACRLRISGWHSAGMSSPYFAL